MKTVLFIPGGMEDLSSRDYKSVIKAIEERGYRVKFIPIQWKRTTINDWVKQFNKEYSSHDAKDVILAGFSWGSVIAFLCSVERSPYELWLFSFSPYFSDDIPKFKKSWLNEIGHRRVDTFSKLDFNKYVKAIKCRTLIFVGEQESKIHPLIGSRAKIANKLITNSELFVVPAGKHDVASQVYIDTITNNI